MHLSQLHVINETNALDKRYWYINICKPHSTYGQCTHTSLYTDDECDGDTEATSGGGGEGAEAKDGSDLYMRLGLLLGEGAAPPSSASRTPRAASSHTSFSSLSASSEVNTTTSNNTSPVSTLNGMFSSLSTWAFFTLAHLCTCTHT